jgi:hypothetical protein
MRRLATVLAGTTIAVVAAFVPSAHAAVVRSGCGAVVDEASTGTYSGVVYTYAVFGDQGSHTIRCYVTVDGSRRASTPPQSGTGFVATVGNVSFSASASSSKDLCTEVDGTTVSCGPMTVIPNTIKNPLFQPACSDGIDNDHDGRTDYGSDPECASPSGTSEGLPGSAPACRDGIDNDLDGHTDYPDDQDCAYPGDGTSESAPSGTCTTLSQPPVCVSYTTGSVYQTFTVSGPGSASLPVKGYLQAYDIPSPLGGFLTVPCVVLVGGPDACAALGGHPTPNQPPTTLVDTPAPVPTGLLTVPLATVRVCNATLTLKIDVYGVSNSPAYAVC